MGRLPADIPKKKVSDIVDDLQNIENNITTNCFSVFTLKICLAPLRLHHQSPFWEATTGNIFSYSKGIYNGIDLTWEKFSRGYGHTVKHSGLTKMFSDIQMVPQHTSLPECTLIFFICKKKNYDYIICITLLFKVIILLRLLNARTLSNWTLSNGL